MGRRRSPTILVDKDAALAERQAAQLGFAEWSTDWQTALDKVDAVIIAVPSFMHREIALGRHRRRQACAVREAGRPLGGGGRGDRRGRRDAPKITNGVGFTYVRAPLVRHAATIVRSGSSARRSAFAAGMRRTISPIPMRRSPGGSTRASPGAAVRSATSAGTSSRSRGSSADRSVSLSGLAETRYADAPDRHAGEPPRAVDNEDWAAMLVRFGSGAVGNIEASRIAHGRKMDIGFELICERGSIAFHGERANELRLYRHRRAGGRSRVSRPSASTAPIRITAPSSRRRPTASASTT